MIRPPPEMGNSCCRERSRDGKRKTVTLLLVGLDNAGKTVAAKGLAGEKPDPTMPTVGFSVIPLKYTSCDVRVYDLGGGANIRGIWHRYFADVHGVIFVIDSTDVDRFKEARDVLEDILGSDKIMGKPLLILANKQDRDGALDEIDVIEYLEVEALANTYHCPTLVQSCAANESFYNKIEPGIKSGYNWLMSYIIRNYERLNARVQIDVIDQTLKEREAMLEKIKKMREEREREIEAKDPEAIVPYSEYINSLNGIAAKKVDTADELSVKSSSSSSLTFPSVCHVSGPVSSESGRPKSAVQLVRHQLQLNNGGPIHSSRINKTAPIVLYAPKHPSSAGERRGKFSKTLRTLKSADDSIFTISHNKVGPSGDYRGEKFELAPSRRVKRLAQPKNGAAVRSNGFPRHAMDAITVVDVD
ncbi:ADP-ribosylation factor-like protein 13B [Cylas formicarius]|uniref:ADP-ribosylation factor-like protein 13B n=1 Tax=Cylas formicarius TaxID=197179 RepID=UPI002958B695|nr:ADP-ribosylation factor-like protein 13B [Cylas formicarius]